MRLAVAFLLGAIMLCVAPASEAHDNFRLLQLDGRFVKWGEPAFGTGTSISYAILDSTAVYSGIRNCRQTGNLDGILNEEITETVFESELAAAFAMWENVANVEFAPAREPDDADIVIGAQLTPRGVGYADISSERTPSDGIRRAAKGVVCLNPDLAWISSDPSLQLCDRVSLKYVLAHEIGHLLGLDHPNPRGSLMSFQHDGGCAELRPGDIAGAVFLYGQRPAQIVGTGLSIGE